MQVAPGTIGQVSGILNFYLLLTDRVRLLLMAAFDVGHAATVDATARVRRFIYPY